MQTIVLVGKILVQFQQSKVPVPEKNYFFIIQSPNHSFDSGAAPRRFVSDLDSTAKSDLDPDMNLTYIRR